MLIITIKNREFPLDFLSAHDIIGVHKISKVLLTFLKSSRELGIHSEASSYIRGGVPRFQMIEKQKNENRDGKGGIEWDDWLKVDPARMSDSGGSFCLENREDSEYACKGGCSGRIWVFSGSRKRRAGRAGGSQGNDDSFVPVSSSPVSHDRSGRH